MAEYWVVRTTGAAVEGPFNAAQLQAMARDGTITHASMVHGGGQWHDAATVKGLFDAPTEAAPGGAAPRDAAPSANTEPYIVEDAPEVAVAPTELTTPGFPPSPGHFGGESATSFGPATGPPGRRRNLNWLVVVSSLLLAFAVATFIVSLFDGSSMDFDSFQEWFEDDTIYPSELMSCFQLVLWFGIWIYWLVWVFMVHDEVHRFTGGQHSISPGLALGLSFVPVFNFFWGIFMPFKLALLVTERTGGPMSRLAPPILLTFLILTLVPGCCFWPGLAMLFKSLAMRHLQNGLNDMWEGPAPAAHGSSPFGAPA